MSVKIILINLHLTTCESLKNQVFIRQTTASKPSAALIIAQCFYSSSSSTRLWCLLILSDSAARKLLPESRAMKVAFRLRKARIFVTYLRKIILSTQGCKKRTGCRWKKGSKGASKLTILGLDGRNVSLCTEGDTVLYFLSILSRLQLPSKFINRKYFHTLFIKLKMNREKKSGWFYFCLWY